MFFKLVLFYLVCITIFCAAKMKKKFYYPVAILLIAFRVQCFAQKTSGDFEIKKLADGVYAAIHKPGGRAVCNAGIVDLGKETLVIDPFIFSVCCPRIKKGHYRNGVRTGEICS
jgi:hypothetical protein